MSIRNWLGRSVWLAVWLAWAWFGYWLYVNLPRTFVLVNRLAVEPRTSCLGFVRDTRLVAMRGQVTLPDRRVVPGPVELFDAATGARVSEFAAENDNAVTVSVETGLVAASVAIPNGELKNMQGLEVADLLTGERSRVPNVAESAGWQRPTFHRTFPWLGVLWKDVSQGAGAAIERRVAVYDAAEKRLLFDSIRPDEGDASTYFVTRPIFVDGARRFGVMVRSRKRSGVRLDVWEIPQDAKPYRVDSTPWNEDLETFVGLSDRITADGDLVSVQQSYCRYYNIRKRRIDDFLNESDFVNGEAVVSQAKLVVDSAGRRIATRDRATAWEWPAGEILMWHDGSQTCWMDDGATETTLANVHRRVRRYVSFVPAPGNPIVLRELATGKIRCRAFAPVAYGPKFGLRVFRMRPQKIHIDRSHAYIVCEDRDIYYAEPRPMWGLIAAAQAIVATPFVLLWIFRRWRRSRMR